MIVTKPSAGTNFATATCLMTDDVGDFVYFTGPKVGVDYQVTKVDTQLVGKMPAVGVIIAKPAPNRAVVQFSGEVNVFSGLTPGKIYWVGTSGQATMTPPSPTAGQKRYTQSIGVASDTNKIKLNISNVMIVQRG